MPFGETIVALATPVGESALALVRASGPLCSSLVESIFKRKHRTSPKKANVGNYHSLGGEVLDNCVYVFYEEGKSYTGEELLELSLHGNPLIVQTVIEDLVKRGCRMAEPGEFTRTAFNNNKLDLSQAEAVADLIHARSEKAIRAAQQQLGGALGRRTHEFSDRLLQIIAELEAYIDFPEEDLPPEDEAGPAASIQSLIQDFNELIQTSHYSALLHEGIRTVIVGAPNAGKSSLLNAFVGEERAIVSSEPGTTRDFLQERLIVGPYCLQIMDTAGLHESTSELERMGIAKTKEKVKEADFFIVVVDSAAPSPTLPEEIISFLQPSCTLVVENKIDLVPCEETLQFLADCPRARVSLKTGKGVAELRDSLIATLEKDKVVPSEDALIVSSRHATALQKAVDALTTASEKLKDEVMAELVASDLRAAIAAVGEIVGKIDNEAMLDKLFASFCIGK